MALCKSVVLTLTLLLPASAFHAPLGTGLWGRGAALEKFSSSGTPSTPLGPLFMMAQPRDCMHQDRRAHLGLLAGAALASAAPAFAEGKGAPSGGRLAGEKPLDPSKDVIFPAWLLGEWQCQRVVALVEGDAGQAALVWTALGGIDGATFSGKTVESFATRFIASPPSIQNKYVFACEERTRPRLRDCGETLAGVVLDRGFETDARTHGASVAWDPSKPGSLQYQRSTGSEGAVEIAVVQRRVEVPSEKGWGGSELVSVTTNAGVVPESLGGLLGG
ncbi:hypothetical protein T484DRAFT_1881603, partial [Baffinella frigidus]